MKKIFLFIIVIGYHQILLAQKLKGSDSLLPLAQKQVEIYLKTHPNAKLMVTGGGSAVGIRALIDGHTDIAMSSRKIKTQERFALRKKKQSVMETVVAQDAVTVIVHPHNRVNRLTRRQLEDIFRGKITNWKQVGGNNKKIVVFSRQVSSGTYDIFKDVVLRRKNYTNYALSLPATGAIIESISQTEGGIGYVGLGYSYLEESVKPLQVSFDGGKNYIIPSTETVNNHTYPISRPLYYYYVKRKYKKVRPFLNFVLSSQGQEIVKLIGYVSLSSGSQQHP